jgi:predicted type IV restriction endonuclease
MPTISEKNAETLIHEHLREQGWPLTDFSVVTKGFKDGLEGLEADYAILRDWHPAALIEAMRPGKDL